MEQPISSTMIDELQLSAAALQKDLAIIDLYSSASSSGYLELILLEYKEIIIRIDANLNHGRGHVHIDYAKTRHAASYAIDNGERLAGKSNPYDNAIKTWILANNDNLNRVWTDIRDKGVDETLVAHLKSSNFG